MWVPLEFVCCLDYPRFCVCAKMWVKDGNSLLDCSEEEA